MFSDSAKSVQGGAKGGSSMKLSTAIKLGAMMKPQGRGDFLVNGATCANGAALDAIGQLERTPVLGRYRALAQAWPFVNTLHVVPPVGYTAGACPLDMAIEELNDVARWTREQIADWVATFEPQEAPQAEEPVCISVSKK